VKKKNHCVSGCIMHNNIRKQLFCLSYLVSVKNLRISFSRLLNFLHISWVPMLLRLHLSSPLLPLLFTFDRSFFSLNWNKHTFNRSFWFLITMCWVYDCVYMIELRGSKWYFGFMYWNFTHPKYGMGDNRSNFIQIQYSVESIHNPPPPKKKWN